MRSNGGALYEICSFSMTMVIGEKNARVEMERMDDAPLLILFPIGQGRFPGYKSYFVAMPTRPARESIPFVW